MRKQWKDNLINKNNIVVIYTIIVFAFGIVLTAGMIYLFFINKKINLVENTEDQNNFMNFFPDPRYLRNNKDSNKLLFEN